MSVSLRGISLLLLLLYIHCFPKMSSSVFTFQKCFPEYPDFPILGQNCPFFPKHFSVQFKCQSETESVTETRSQVLIRYSDDSSICHTHSDTHTHTLTEHLGGGGVVVLSPRRRSSTADGCRPASRGDGCWCHSRRRTRVERGTGSRWTLVGTLSRYTDKKSPLPSQRGSPETMSPTGVKGQ